MTTVCLVRHGETDWNAEGRIQGQTDIPLNENGKIQADECGQFLQVTDWDLLITSPLQRAKQTATIINQYLNLSMIEMDEFRERGFGDAEGMTVEERLRYFSGGNYPNQEGREELSTRLVDGLNSIHQHYTGKKVLLVAHGAVINMILSLYSKGEIGSGKTTLGNGCISHIEWLDESWKINRYNQTDHLSTINQKGNV
ncbi:histidine phosphatase family protein [Gracilibacillus kekensis]|uniref:Broad-specificity phosphatase PhoE n=1 Tax=Gracilibacillus kekensis TaxID=1027249 RepID=A0A1M7PXF0_9BACI|nr:histidine phosphatase family protein [Gracilibacillus kekensis]SHN22271.1 broad-specificity phosphatase PhoE [Gracilibacillus kekensis]